MAWHAGERAVQERAGVAEVAARMEGMLGDTIPGVAQEFLRDQPWIVLGAADAGGRVWATVLYGAPGFLETVDPRTLRVGARPLPGDALAEALAAPREVGGLAIEPATRRRMRLNGRSRPEADGLLLHLEQVYANCPKYIATREVVDVAPRSPAPTVRRGSALTPGQQALLAAADTAFIATRAPGEGADVSHRGGRPGFLQTPDPGRVVLPDYQGNAMFNTLGNLQVDPSAGLTVVDPESGTTLQLSGRASVVWDPERIAVFPGAQRLVELEVDAVVESVAAAPLRWRLERPARNPAAPGPQAIASASATVA